MAAASQDWFEKDFYATLGVSSDASAAEIKKAYRNLARKYHPDTTSGDKSAEQKFKEVGEAHQVLADPEQRKEYDAVRAMAKGGPRFTAGPGGAAGGFEDVFSQMFGHGTPGGAGSRSGAGRTRYRTTGPDVDIDELLRQMGGGGGGFNPSNYGRVGEEMFGPRKGNDIAANTTITFRSATQGETVSLGMPDGPVNVRIPAGVRDGQKIRVKGKGRPGAAGAPAGDLILEVKVTPHPVFGRDGNHLTVDLPVTYAEAALGATVEVPTLDGNPVKVRLAPGTPNGRVLRVRDRGIKAKAGTGDLLAKVVVSVPTELSDAAREALSTLAAETTGDPRAELFAKARS